MTGFSHLVEVNGVRRSTSSATLATVSASAFLILSGLLSFVPDAPSDVGETWHLRGPLALRSPWTAGPASVAGLREAPKPV